MISNEIIKKLQNLLDEKDIFIGYNLDDYAISPYYYTQAKDPHKRKCVRIDYQNYSIANVLAKAIEVVENTVISTDKP
jgi:hypothetical protein